MITPITPAEVAQNRVSALPSRPNASTAFGGLGYTSAQLRAAFDRLPELIVERYNSLVASLTGQDSESLMASLPTTITSPSGESYSLQDILSHITDGTFATYLKVGASYLDVALAALAPTFSPHFTGTPTAPTPATSDDSGKLATTAWVKNLLSNVMDYLNEVQQGKWGQVPTGGSAGEMLIKVSDQDHDLAWQGIESYAFASPTAITQGEGDNSTKVATTAFVKKAADNLRFSLLDGVESQYDTLKEIVAALKENDADIAEALQLIASKDNKTTIATFADGDELELEGNYEYRSLDAITSFMLVFPSEPTEDFLCALEFNTHISTDLSYSYDNAPKVFCTGDDTADGVFIPKRDCHYTIVFWYANNAYQGVVRRCYEYS